MNDAQKELSFDDVCVLIKTETTRGDMGERIETETKQELFCMRKGINQNEFYKAHQDGMRCDLCLLVYSDEYEHEQDLSYDNRLYKIYRVYERNDGLSELYCEERTGVNGRTD